MKTDILVIGTGISGLSYAIKVAENHPEFHLTLISKNDLAETNTRYAQGGIAVVTDHLKDSHEKHIQDTLIAGAGKSNPEVVRFVVEEGQARLLELMQWGTSFDTKEQTLHLAQEGGHSEKRIVHYKDQTGLQIQETLIQKIKSFDHVTLLENHTLVDLITDHHTKTQTGRCHGAYVIASEKAEILTIQASITVLSTGGAGELFEHTTNPPSATGDGLGAAYRAKVFIEGLPYVQFHPTALYPKVEDQTFLITEAVRGAGGVLRNPTGERFMPEYDPRAELAPRDIVARAIQQEIEKSGEDFVWLDVREMTAEKLERRFPNIKRTCASLGIQLPHDWIPIVPAAHYFCGGIRVNAMAEAGLEGLYAIGECAHTGLHGANRLASNSLLESLVFAHRAALSSVEKLQYWRESPPASLTLPLWQGEGYTPVNSNKRVIELKQELQKTMTRKAGIFKSTAQLKAAEQTLKNIFEETKTIYENNQLTAEMCELRNLVSVAYLLIKQSQNICTNEGVFYNHDLVQ
ncbi:MAG: L-aspartate oxidase [Flavobacteriaceae bacterium]